MENLLISLFTALATLYLLGSIMLFLNSRGIRARLFLAFIVLYLGLYFVTGLVLHYNDYSSGFSFLSTQLIFNGALRTFVVIAYPIEVLCGGWLNLKRYLLLATPILFIGLLYLLDVLFFNSENVIITSLSDLGANIFVLNVLVRVLGLLTTVFYFLYPFLLIERNIKVYNENLTSNFSDITKYNIRWLRLLMWSLIFTFIIRIVWIVSGLEFVGVIYVGLLIIISTVIIYRGLYQESAMLGIKYKDNIMPISLEPSDENDVLVDDDMILRETLKNYTQKIVEWIDQEKPYLRQDLQLMDIAEIFPINRTYLSRIFNEYIGSSFSQYIKMKRIEFAKELLVSQPNATVNEVALQSGFYSASTMHKAFTSIVGITATQYRSQFVK